MKIRYCEFNLANQPLLTLEFNLIIYLPAIFDKDDRTNNTFKIMTELSLSAKGTVDCSG
jgi:hypothetical protein